MKSGKVLLGVLAGVAAGALLGILFAPEKGTSTRKKILGKGEDYADGLKEKFNEFVDSIGEKYGKNGQRHDINIDTITDKYESVKQEAEEIVSKGKAKYNELKKEANNVTGNS